MDLWANLVANITYTYALEIGPLDSEPALILPGKGFHVEERHIKYVVIRAFYGIHQYMKSFLDKLTTFAQDEVRTTCLYEYEIFRIFHSK